MSASVIKLNLINDSDDTGNSEVVVFQKHNLDELAVAWRVIKHCGRGDHYPFTFPVALTVSASDSYGNFTPQLAAQNGQRFHLWPSKSGDILSYLDPASSPREIQLRNDLTQGAVNAQIFRDGKLLAVKTSILPGQQAAFQFKPTIWIGVVSRIEEGDVMNSAILCDVDAEIPLLGIASADIVMTGGGHAPFRFELANVQHS